MSKPIRPDSLAQVIRDMQRRLTVLERSGISYGPLAPDFVPEKSRFHLDTDADMLHVYDLDDLVWLSAILDPPAVRVRNSTTQNFTPTKALVLYDTEDFDTHNMHKSSPTPGRLTAPRAGIYMVQTGTTWTANNSSTQRTWEIYKNESSLSPTADNMIAASPNQVINSATYTARSYAATIIDLDVDEWVSVYASADIAIGGNDAQNEAGTECFFSAHMIAKLP